MIGLSLFNLNCEGLLTGIVIAVTFPSKSPLPLPRFTTFLYNRPC